MKQNTSPRKVAGMHVGSATLVMLFSVLCLTIFGALSVVTANNGWALAEKMAQGVTNYYQADTTAIELWQQISEDYDGGFIQSADDNTTIEWVDGEERLNYWVSIDQNQVLWVQLCYRNDTVQAVRWEVEQVGTWTTDQSLQVWGG